ncbi:MAG TPA: diacylglycerol kinase family protein [Candidatus Kryptonia bacterium]|nr:diacylglycerol kinase family protein [Candidatus Kryptonia bacterium]
MAGVAVLVNPHAAGNRAEEKRSDRLRRILGSDGEVIETAGLDALPDAMRAIRSQQRDIVAVCGGDGSYFHALSTLIREYDCANLPLFLPLRAGTMNTMIRSIGGRWRRPERMLAHVMTDYRRGHTHEVVERHVLAVAGEHYGFMFGAGPIVNFIRVYYAQKRHGRATAARLIIVLTFSTLLGTSFSRAVFQALEADVDCDGERVPFRRFNIMYASTLVDIGLGFRPTYLATRKPGFFHLLAGPITATELVRKLWRMHRGFPTQSEHLYDNLARRVVVEFLQPTQYMVDGEILGPTNALTIETGPRLRLIRG